MATNLKLFSYLQAVFYIIAGTNHFIHPAFYLPLIPPYLPFPEAINFLSGAFELIFGVMIFRSSTRHYASWGIFLLLILFIPSHIYFIQIGSCQPEGLCVAPLVAWARLLVIHPLLLWSIYRIRKV